MTTMKNPNSSSSKLALLNHIKYEHLVAGISGGVTSTLILHPLDLIKIRFAGKLNFAWHWAEKNLVAMWVGRLKSSVVQSIDLVCTCLNRAIIWHSFWAKLNDTLSELTLREKVESAKGLFTQSWCNISLVNGQRVSLYLFWFLVWKIS